MKIILAIVLFYITASFIITSDIGERRIYIEQFGKNYEFSYLSYNQCDYCYEGTDLLSGREIRLCNSFERKDVVIRKPEFKWLWLEN
jgi:hypothetical protein